MIYAITFIVSLSPFRSQSSTQCDMGDVNDGRTGSVGVSLEPAEHIGKLEPVS